MLFNRRPKIHYDIKAARSTRAIFPQIRGMLPKIQLTFEAYDGTLLELDLDHEIAAEFLDKAEAAYDAAVPQRNPRRATGQISS